MSAEENNGKYSDLLMSYDQNDFIGLVSELTDLLLDALVGV